MLLLIVPRELQSQRADIARVYAPLFLTTVGGLMKCIDCTFDFQIELEDVFDSEFLFLANKDVLCKCPCTLS